VDPPSCRTAPHPPFARSPQRFASLHRTGAATAPPAPATSPEPPPTTANATDTDEPPADRPNREDGNPATESPASCCPNSTASTPLMVIAIPTETSHPPPRRPLDCRLPHPRSTPQHRDRDGDGDMPNGPATTAIENHEPTHQPQPTGQQSDPFRPYLPSPPSTRAHPHQPTLSSNHPSVPRSLTTRTTRRGGRVVSDAERSEARGTDRARRQRWSGIQGACGCARASLASSQCSPAGSHVACCCPTAWFDM